MMNANVAAAPSSVPDSSSPEIAKAEAMKNAWPDYLTIWRWHFYAGLLCIPILIVLSVTGTIYLFKPQLQAAEYGKYQAMVPDGTSIPLPIAEQIKLALAAIPGSALTAYELPPNGHLSATFPTKLQLRLGDDRQLTSYQDPSNGKIIGQQNPDELPENFAKKIHGELLMGKRGSYLVETTACWTLVMVMTGLVLWWPRTGWKLSGMVIPRLTLKGRTFWKDVHSVAGFWLSGLIVFLIVSGLPWATFWGDYFKVIRTATGTAAAKQDWSGGHGGRHGAGHRHDGGAEADVPAAYQLDEIDKAVTFACEQHLAAPVLIRPPKSNGSVWTIQSETQNRPLRTTIKYDVAKATIISQEDFAKRHWIDRAVGQGIAIHEGARFGVFNQILSLLATSGLVLLSGTAVVMWWSRRQVGLGAPPKRDSTSNQVSWFRRVCLGFTLIVMAAAMPLFGASLVAVWLLDQAVLRRIPVVNRWLGLCG